MQLVLGLGNPGSRYALTRHNVGFRCVEVLASRLGLVFEEVQSVYRAAVGAGPSGPVTLLQPLTYMNRSGEALIAWAGRTGYAISAPPQDDPGLSTGGAPGQIPVLEPPAQESVVPVVVCDDLSLELGSLRIRGRGGDGGQKGLASVLRTIGSQDVPRLRLGIGAPGRAVEAVDWSAYVLEEFEDAEQEAVGEMTARGAEALQCLLTHGWELAASRYNRRGAALTDET